MKYDLLTLKWMLELCKQENYKSPSDIHKAYNVEILGC